MSSHNFEGPRCTYQGFRTRMSDSKLDTPQKEALSFLSGILTEHAGFRQKNQTLESALEKANNTNEILTRQIRILKAAFAELCALVPTERVGPYQMDQLQWLVDDKFNYMLANPDHKKVKEVGDGGEYAFEMKLVEEMRVVWGGVPEVTLDNPTERFDMSLWAKAIEDLATGGCIVDCEGVGSGSDGTEMILPEELGIYGSDTPPANEVFLNETTPRIATLANIPRNLSRKNIALLIRGGKIEKISIYLDAKTDTRSAEIFFFSIEAAIRYVAWVNRPDEPLLVNHRPVTANLQLTLPAAKTDASRVLLLETLPEHIRKYSQFERWVLLSITARCLGAREAVQEIKFWAIEGGKFRAGVIFQSVSVAIRMKRIWENFKLKVQYGNDDCEGELKHWRRNWNF